MARAALTTETFTGTVSVAGSDFHTFTAAQTGEIDITLTAAGPPATIFMGLAIGTVAGTTCTHLSGGAVNTPAGTAPQLTGTANAGTYCIDIYDVGNQTGSITYTVAVAHP